MERLQLGLVGVEAVGGGGCEQNSGSPAQRVEAPDLGPELTDRLEPSPPDVHGPAPVDYGGVLEAVGGRSSGVHLRPLGLHPRAPAVGDAGRGGQDGVGEDERDGLSSSGQGRVRANEG